MAQPLAKPEPTADNGIDLAASRLEEAFQRLEAASARATADNDSLRAGHEKLNDLLRGSSEEIARLKEAVYTVTERLDYTINMIEAIPETAE